MRRRRHASKGARALVLFVGILVALHAAWAAHAAIGTAVPDAELPTLQGGAARLHGSGPTVLVFFRAGQERSSIALRELARCRGGLADRPVRWLGVVSDAVAPASAQAMVRESGFDAPVLVDAGDELYGRLGIAQHPVIAIVGRDGTLAAFEPFRALGYCTVVQARLRHALGEITDAELQSVLSPPASPQMGDEQVAGRYRALARLQLKSGAFDKALDTVQLSLDKAPRVAASQALRGEILAAQGRCSEAAVAFRLALALDPSNADAGAGLERCRAPR